MDAASSVLNTRSWTSFQFMAEVLCATAKCGSRVVLHEHDDTRTVGCGEETFEPHFTLHGFRYVKVTGYPGTLTSPALTGGVVHSNMPRTGQFASSDPMLNQAYRNVVWGQKSNFDGVPTDCPQRE